MGQKLGLVRTRSVIKHKNLHNKYKNKKVKIIQ